MFITIYGLERTALEVESFVSSYDDTEGLDAQFWARILFFWRYNFKQPALLLHLKM